MSLPGGTFRREASGHRNINTSANFLIEDTFDYETTKPGPTNTGLPAGHVFTRTINGNLTLSPGEVVEDALINGKVSFAANSGIRRCGVRGWAAWTNSGASSRGALLNLGGPTVVNAFAERCHVEPQTPDGFINGFEGHDFTLDRCRINATVDGGGLWNSHATRTTVSNAFGSLANSYLLNVTIRGTYFEGMTYWHPYLNPETGANIFGDQQSHNDSIQLQGGAGAIIRGNTLRAVYVPGGTHVPPVSGPSPSGHPNVTLAAIMISPNVGQTGLHDITRNWVEGAFLPFNMGSTAANGANLGRAWANRFDGLSGMNVNPKATIWYNATRNQLDAGVGSSTNQNVFYDGTPVLVRTNA